MFAHDTILLLQLLRVPDIPQPQTLIHKEFQTYSSNPYNEVDELL